MPSFTPTPPPDSEQDIVSRLFYDKAGNRIGALDGEGYLTRTVYDAAGRKVQDIAVMPMRQRGAARHGQFPGAAR